MQGRRLSLWIVAAIVSLCLLLQLQFLYWPVVPSNTPYIDYNLAQGTSVIQAARQMHALGILPHPWYFVFNAVIKRQSNHLQAGYYRFVRRSSAGNILQQLVEGKVLKIAFLIPEGWTYNQIMTAMNKVPELRHDLAGLPVNVVSAKIDPLLVNPEGQLFPDTYIFYPGASDKIVLKKAYQQMQAIVAKAWAERAPNLPYQSPQQALIVASLIEKETALEVEKPIIAAVILKRWQARVLLQIDAAVAYGVNHTPGTPLTKTELQMDTPFNTYLHFGLPPNPICMPSLSSLLAALHPATTNAMYFVATGEGGHYFSDNLKDHLHAVSLLRQKQQAMRVD